MICINTLDRRRLNLDLTKISEHIGKSFILNIFCSITYDVIFSILCEVDGWDEIDFVDFREGFFYCVQDRMVCIDVGD